MDSQAQITWFYRKKRLTYILATKSDLSMYFLNMMTIVREIWSITLFCIAWYQASSTKSPQFRKVENPLPTSIIIHSVLRVQPIDEQPEYVWFDILHLHGCIWPTPPLSTMLCVYSQLTSKPKSFGSIVCVWPSMKMLFKAASKNGE